MIPTEVNQVEADRSKAIQAFLVWATTGLPLNKTVSFDKEQLANELKILPSHLYKTLFVFRKHGYIEFQQLKHESSRYRLVKELTAVTPQLVDGWIREYQREADRRAKDKLADNSKQPNPSTGIEGLSFSGPVIYRDVPTEGSVETLSPAQKLLQQGVLLPTGHFYTLSN